MKLKQILENSMDIANSIYGVEQLKKNKSFVQILTKLHSPKEKYIFIITIADMLGIPEDKFPSFINNLKNL